MEDPDTKVRQRWTKRHDRIAHSGRISKVALRKARPLVLAAAARHAALARWAGKTPEQRRAHSAMMNLARKDKAA